MKRVTLEIDLQENDVFEKEIENIIRAKVRECVRNEGLDIIRDEAEKEIKRILYSTGWQTPRIESIVASECDSEIRKYVKEFNIRTVVEDRVPKIIDQKITTFGGNIEEKIAVTVDKILTQEVTKKLKGIFGNEGE